MPFNFELTISGLCVIVLKSKIDRPPTPSAVDILCVAAYGHRPRLSYFPEYVDLEWDSEPELRLDPKGTRIASLDVSNLDLKLALKNNPATAFDLNWGDKAKNQPPTSAEESWMQWVPSVPDLDLAAIRIAGMSYGIGARLSLPFGKIYARNVVKDEANNYALWEFPSVNRALANEVVYSAPNVDSLTITWDTHQLTYARNKDLLMCLSNDMDTVPSDYSAGTTELHHMAHLQNLAEPPKSVKVPKLHTAKKTGRPICNQVYFVDMS